MIDAPPFSQGVLMVAFSYLCLLVTIVIIMKDHSRIPPRTSVVLTAEEMAKIKEDASGKDAMVARASAEIKQLKDEIAQLKRELEMRDTGINAYKETIGKAEDATLYWSREAQRLSRELMALTSEYKGYNSRIEKLKRVESEAGKIEEALIDEKKSLEEIRSRVGDARAKLQQYENDIKEMTKKNE
jgi:chromosome segregation ATPase